MTYDFHGPWDDFIGHNTPLKSSNSSDKATVSYAVEYWLNKGAQSNKINLGIATYGRSFLYDTKPSINEISKSSGKAGRV